MSDFINLTNREEIFKDNIRKSFKHKEWMTIHGKHGDYVSQRTKGRKDEAKLEKPEGFHVNEAKSSRLSNKLLFAHHYDGEFYDNQGQHIPLSEDWKEYAKGFKGHEWEEHVKKVIIERYEGQNGPLSENDKNKIMREHHAVKRNNFLAIKDKIDKHKAELQRLDDKKHIKQTNHENDFKLIKNRLKTRIKSLQTPSTFRVVPNTSGTEHTGHNLTILERGITDIRDFFKDPSKIQVKYTINGKDVEESLSSMADKITNKHQHNKKEQPRKHSEEELAKVGLASHYVHNRIHPNDRPFKFENFEIVNFNDLDIFHINKQGASSVNFLQFNLTK